MSDEKVIHFKSIPPNPGGWSCGVCNNGECIKDKCPLRVENDPEPELALVESSPDEEKKSSAAVKACTKGA